MKNAKKVDKVLSQLTKQFGEEIIFKGNESEKLKIEWMDTGLLCLNRATKPNQGSGGIPRGRVVEMFGPERSGKTTLALSIVAEEQKKGNLCAFLDNENAFNPEFAKMMGVDVDELIFSKDNEGERTIDAIEALIRTGEFSLIVVDSVAGLAPIAELQSNMEDQHMALAARMWSKAMRKLTATLSKNKCTLMLINQLRDNVGVMYGQAEITPGGRAIKFFSDMRIEVKGRQPYYVGNGDDREQIGHAVRVRVKKNKVGTDGGVALFDLYYDKGFDLKKDIIGTAIASGVVSKSGGWHTYIPLGIEEGASEVIKENGVDNFIEAIKNVENADLMMEELRERVLLGRTEPLYYENKQSKS